MPNEPMSPGMACILVVVEPMTDEELEELADTGDTSELKQRESAAAFDRALDQREGEQS